MAITQAMYPSPEAYFEGLHRDLLLQILGGSAAYQAMDTTDGLAYLVVPDHTPPAQGWGVYLHISANNDGSPRSSWNQVLASRDMIYLGPHGAGNGEWTSRRLALALDALATIQASQPVDPGRLVMGGFSGGAAVGVMVGAHYPDLFVGTVDMARAVMWEEHEISTIPGSIFGLGEVDQLDPVGLESLQRGHRFAFITGDRDILDTSDGPFANYEGILDGLGDWWARDLRTRVWDVPDHGHAPAPAATFDEALGWVLTCEDLGTDLPRFDSDHRPPITPIPSPPGIAPNPCELYTGATGVDTGGGGNRGKVEGGCGCQSNPTPSGWSPLLLTLILRRRQPRT